MCADCVDLTCRVVLCRVRQTTGFTGKDFQKTPNDEYMTMLKEAGEFQTPLKKTYTKLSEMKLSNESFGKSAKALLQAPLPRVHSETAAAAGANVSSVLRVGGPDFDAETLSAKAMAASSRLEGEVLVPIKRWLDSYDTLKTNVKTVEDLRLEVDSRRHTVADLSSQVDKYRAKLNKGPNSKTEQSMEDTIKKLQHKEGKLTLTLERFQDASGALIRNLETLIKAAEDTRHYLAVAFQAQADSYEAAAKAIGPTKAPEAPLTMSTLTLNSPSAKTGDESDDEVASPGTLLKKVP